MTAGTLVRSRFEALAATIFGVEAAEWQADYGPWRWSFRRDSPLAIATWRHERDWGRTVEIVPVHYTQVAVEFPDGSRSDWYDHEGDAIDHAARWLTDHTEVPSGGGS